MKTYMNEATKRIFKRGQEIIDDHGTRLAGSKSDLDAADDLLEDLKTFADEAHQETFKVYPGAFLGWIRILVFNYLIALVCFYLDYMWVSFGVLLLSVLILIFQFFLYLPVIDRFYPKREGKNVVGVIEPKGEVKQQVIVSGHHDSAHIFNFFIHQPKLYNLRTTGSIGYVIVFMVVSFFLAILPLDTLFIQIMQVIFTASFLLIGQMWFFASKKGTPGAGDNLVASLIAFEIGKYFKTKKQLKNTRVIVLSFDAEEEGLRGARAYVKAHLEELKQTKTYVLNADCLYDEKELFFLTSDLNNFVKFDEDLVDELIETAKAENYVLKKQPLAFLTGGTDGAEFAKKGISTTTLIGMPWTNDNRNQSYHTPNDTLDHVHEQVVSDALGIFIQYIEKKDQAYEV